MRPDPRVRCRSDAKKLDACPECGSPLTQAEAPVVRLVSSLDWTYPAPHAGKKCKACGWQVG